MKKIVLLFMSMLVLGSCAKRSFEIDTYSINRMNYNTVQMDEELHSAEYLVVDISECNFLYAKDADAKMYPASLTKLVTLDTVLNLSDDLYDYSYVSNQQVEDLIKEDASLAYIRRDYPYTLKDLLYALVLPSGADAAVALENYYTERNIDLVTQMNLQMEKLGGNNSHFINTTGLHEDDHYSCLNDLYLVVMDILNYKEGREILNTITYTMEDGIILHTSAGIAYRDNDFTVLGGKTGYTPEAGQNIIVLCKDLGKSYLVMTGNAYGSYSLNQYWHYDDVTKVFEYLHKN